MSMHTLESSFYRAVYGHYMRRCFYEGKCSHRHLRRDTLPYCLIYDVKPYLLQPLKTNTADIRYVEMTLSRVSYCSYASNLTILVFSHAQRARFLSLYWRWSSVLQRRWTRCTRGRKSSSRFWHGLGRYLTARWIDRQTGSRFSKASSMVTGLERSVFMDSAAAYVSPVNNSWGRSVWRLPHWWRWNLVRIIYRE